jgi:hypothetical protein
MSLRTGEIIVRRTWTELPIPSEVIDRIVELTTNEVDYEDYQEELDELDLDDPQDENERENDNEIQKTNKENNTPEIELGDELPENEIEEEEDENEIEEEEDTEETQRRAHGYDLRPNRRRDYRYAFLSVREGLKQFGLKGKEAILEELKLFLNGQVFKKINDLTDDQRKRALRIHCFLTEKRDGRIKARAVADGRSQIRYTMEETYSPTVKLESIMLCTLIEALEGRDTLQQSI